MNQIYITETFKLPKWRQICAIITLLLCGGACLITIWQSLENPKVLIATAILLLVIVSIYVYIRTRLELSDQEIMYFDGMKPVYVKWSNVVAIDMKMKGKYSELEVFVYYDNRRFTLDATHFGKKQLKRILELLEMKVDQSLFSPSYQQLRAERLPRSVASK